MEERNCLGIYISPDGATVVAVGAHAREQKPAGCFSISLEQDQKGDWQLLGSLIAQRCAEKQLNYFDVAVAVDCSLFMQHSVHSSFTDAKQIASTIRFDTEEALATDISDVALAFKVDSQDENGSDLTVFTAKRNVLSEILTALQQNDLDPVAMEPDVNCLAGFLRQKTAFSDDQKPLFAIFGSGSAYIIAFGHEQKPALMRSFLIRTVQDRSDLLARELLVTRALLATAGNTIDSIRLLDSEDSVQCNRLSQTTGIDIDLVDFAEMAGVEPEDITDCADTTSVAIAFGAALVAAGRIDSSNLRNDFNPYQGRKLRLQKAFKFLSASVTILLVALGIYLQLQLIQQNEYRRRLKDLFAVDYLAVMLNTKEMPTKTAKAVSKLGSERRRIESEKKGLIDITGKKAVAAKLHIMLDAFNKSAADSKLQIDAISITTKSITVTGSTRNRAATLKLRDLVKQAKLGNLQENLQTKAGRDNFNITIVPGK